jgi:hypothetical protein
VLQAKPVIFNWADGSGIGMSFVAQQIQSIDSRFVSESTKYGMDGKVIENSNYLGLKSHWFVPVLFKAIQEQQQQILELQAQIKQLQTPKN